MSASAPESPRASAAPWVDYDYAVVRVVPCVHREAFVNVGVVLHARQARVLAARIHPAPGALAGLEGVSPRLLAAMLDAYAAVAEGAGPVGAYPPSERFHWLTAPRSAVLQCGPVHSGRTQDPAATLDTLYTTYVDPDRNGA